MRTWQDLWSEESGMVLSSEVVLLGTLGVIGATVGLSAASKSVNDELTELAFAFRSLDQSYHIEGTKSCSGWTAGSEFIQPCKEKSIAELKEQVERQSVAAERARREAEMKHHAHEHGVHDRGDHKHGDHSEHKHSEHKGETPKKADGKQPDGTPQARPVAPQKRPEMKQPEQKKPEPPKKKSELPQKKPEQKKKRKQTAA